MKETIGELQEKAFKYMKAIRTLKDNIALHYPTDAKKIFKLINEAFKDVI